MAISAKDVKDLRQTTGMGMMECKKALTETDGDVQKAIELLREWAGGKMDTREADAGEGALAIAQSGDGIAIVKIVTETDFAARNEDFLAKAHHHQRKDRLRRWHPLGRPQGRQLRAQRP